MNNNNTVVFGLLRGDEGKGKIVDYISDKHDIVVRYAGGPNAGHTIYRGDKKVVLHQIPSGILNGKLCFIGRGCVVDLKKLVNELFEIQNLIDNNLIEKNIFNTGYKKKHDVKTPFEKNDTRDIRNYLVLSYGAHIITLNNIKEDIERENAGNGNGSTKCGIAPTYRSKYYRNGLRAFDIFSSNSTILAKETSGLTFDEYEYLKPILGDDEYLLNVKYKNFDKLFEGAQGTLLDIDSPYYPNVSSSSPGIGGVITGTGINANKLFENFNSIGVAKVYMSSVGVGKFLTKINDENAELIRNAGNEYGATTGRPRKVGWFDLPLLVYSIRTSGIKELCITRFDTLMNAMKEIGKFKVCIAYKNKYSKNIIYDANIWHLDEYEPVYEEFDIWNECSLDDKNFMKFINFVQKNIERYDCKLKYLSIGKNKKDIIIL